ncbi:MAG: septation protein A, partial [Gammaproteobacteria bacterium]|nr:septation protein A [Gammaproteobacteria bacterium]
MKFLVDFFPIVLFFVAYKFGGIYVATSVAIVTSVIQVSYEWFRYKKVEMMQWVTLALIVLLGGATLLLHNEIFIKWKPTVINWVLALLFLGSHYIGKEPLIKRMMSSQVNLPEAVWSKLSFSWVGFFFVSGLANIYVAYHFSTNTWVDFKLFGVLGLTVIFVLLQAVYLS